jgi:dTDP-4-dehydrorhamnose reductase
MDKVLITGCGGMLGEAAYDLLSKTYDVTATDIDLNEPWLQRLDVRNIWEFEAYFKSNRFTKIFHLAALTDLEYCESHQKNAWATNTLGVENAAIMAKKYDAELVYISTAGIFDGAEDQVFTDYDNPSPESVYGKSKYKGELIAQSVKKHYVFRAGWMMGGYEKDKKFVKKIKDQLDDGHKDIYAVTDKLGTPTYTWDFIRGIVRVMSHGYYGVYNQVCSGECSRYDVAKEIVRHIGDDDVKVIAVTSEHFKEAYSAPRPLSEKLTNFKLSSMGLNGMKDWDDSLEQYLKAWE